jgi:hypothetical protein
MVRAVLRNPGRAPGETRPALHGLAAALVIGALAAVVPPVSAQAPAAKPEGSTAPAEAVTEPVKTTARPQVRTASSTSKLRSSGRAPAAKRPPAPGVAREERVTYHYNALGRRDPFASLINGFVGMDVGGAAPPDVGGIKVVGIVWGASDKFALVEDPRGNSLVLRRGDKVMNGVVEELRRDAVIVQLDVDGVSQTVTIPVTRKGESDEKK